MASSKASSHVLMVSFPGQGHVNPLLRLAKSLASKGLFITFSTAESFGKDIRNANNITDSSPIRAGQGAIRFEFFDDEWETNSSNFYDFEAYFRNLDAVGKEKLKLMINKYEEEEGRPVCYIINNSFVPWVCDVAEAHGIPSAALWVQSCACFAAYYYYHHSLVSFPTAENPHQDVKLPCMPILKHDEIPSFLHPSTPYAAFAGAILGQFKNLEKPFCVLMDTFQELERELIEFMNTSKFCPPIKPIGPLFKNCNTPLASQIRGDKMKADEDCITWLDSRPALSVVYISFGSIVHLKQEQVDEVAEALVSSDVSFLWVMKPPQEGSPYEPHVLPEGFLGRVGESNKGKIVQWSPQEKVLAHPSVACFFTHCGWNSTMEALANGVPLLVFPEWGDQVTNAKFLVDVYGVGIRVCRGAAEGRIIPRDEIGKCLVEAMSGVKAAEMRGNALKWQNKAEEAVVEGGSSAANLQSFVDEMVSKAFR